MAGRGDDAIVSLNRALLFMIGALGAAGATALPARAHPHVFVDVDVQIEIADDGTPKRLHYTWTFDEMYSAFAVQGLARAQGKPSAQALEKLAGEIVEKLDNVDYFTNVAAADHELQAIAAEHARASVEDGRLRLSFVVELRSIKGPAQKVAVRVFDPSYVVALTLTDAVRLSGPAHCRLAMTRPGALSPSDARQLDDSVRTNALDPNFGAKLAGAIAVDCAPRE